MNRTQMSETTLTAKSSEGGTTSRVARTRCVSGEDIRRARIRLGRARRPSGSEDEAWSGPERCGYEGLKDHALFQVDPEVISGERNGQGIALL